MFLISCFLSAQKTLAMDAEVTSWVSQLREAVQVMMDPNTPHSRRVEAYQACENFKENSPHCAQCGVVMARKENDAIFRHFGLQLLEQRVRYTNVTN